jgi:hypothetical protein
MWVLVHHGWLSWASYSVAMFNSVNHGFSLRMGIFIMDAIVQGQLQHMFMEYLFKFQDTISSKSKIF